MRNLLVIVIATFVPFSACFPQSKGTEGQESVLRAPFVLKLRIDDGHYYEERFGRVPYVVDNDVYLFAGETLGVNVTIVENQLPRITYQKDPSKADLRFKFTQEKSANGLIMLLEIRNTLNRRVVFDARMTVPGKKEIYKTTILPVRPHLRNIESWPHPIVQLMLGNLRLSDNGSKPN